MAPQPSPTHRPASSPCGPSPPTAMLTAGQADLGLPGPAGSTCRAMLTWTSRESDDHPGPGHGGQHGRSARGQPGEIQRPGARRDAKQHCPAQRAGAQQRAPGRAALHGGVQVVGPAGTTPGAGVRKVGGQPQRGVRELAQHDRVSPQQPTCRAPTTIATTRPCGPLAPTERAVPALGAATGSDTGRLKMPMGGGTPVPL